MTFAKQFSMSFSNTIKNTTNFDSFGSLKDENKTQEQTIYLVRDKSNKYQCIVNTSCNDKTILTSRSTEYFHFPSSPGQSFTITP